jgi:formylglycine-generating enzyme required for sulfatase activity
MKRWLGYVLLAATLAPFLPWGGAGGSERGMVLRERPAGVRDSERRTALVIGNGAYERSPLRNPVHDARAMADVLRTLGFDVAAREDLNEKEMKLAIRAFGQSLLKGGVGLFYFAGHGVQVNGRNYLIPVGAAIDHERQVEYEGVDVGLVLAEMEYAKNRMNIVILDACRDNPFARGFRSGAKGLAAVDAPSGTLIAYATAPGAVASDGQGENGLYTGELVKVMEVPGLKIEDVFKQVRTAVKQATEGRQIPWESSSLEGDFYFVPPMNGGSAMEASPAEREAAVTPAGAVKSGEGRGRPAKTWKEPVTGMEFIHVPGGCFVMGSADTERDRDPDESPLHQVCVDAFWLSRSEVSNGQYRQFQPGHDSRDYRGVSLNGDSQPAVFVSWLEAKAFLKWLKERNGGQYTFRLPTEAEWEYACRALSEASRYWGEDADRACLYENVADRLAQKQWSWTDTHQCDDGYAATAPVGTFQANGFGLHDMLGNVAEWCEDVYQSDGYTSHAASNPLLEAGGSDAHRVIRGGFWSGQPAQVRCAARRGGLPGGRNDDLGLRVVRQP